LPIGIPAQVRGYVAAAVRSGTVDEASFRVKGDLWDFPYATAKQGDFRIAAKARDVEFAFVPGRATSATQAAEDSPWPALAKVNGELIFDHHSMEVRNARARIHEFELAEIRGGIRNLADHSVLALEGHGRGPMADALRFVNGSPVAEWTGDALRQASVSGTGELKLALNLPLHDLGKSTVQGSVVLAARPAPRACGVRPSGPRCRGSRSLCRAKRTMH
jgi:uncharacterized protein YhdP